MQLKSTQLEVKHERIHVGLILIVCINQYYWPLFFSSNCN